MDSVRVLRKGIISSPYFIPLRQSEHEMPKVEHGKWPWCEFSWRIESTVIQKRITSQDKTSWVIFVFLLYISFYLFIHSCALGLHLNVRRTESSHLLILLTIGFLRNFGQKTCFHTIFSLILSMDWFLYDIGLRRERVTQNNSHSHTFLMIFFKAFSEHFSWSTKIRKYLLRNFIPVANGMNNIQVLI